MNKKQAIAAVAAAVAVVNFTPNVADAKINSDIYDLKWSTKTKYEWVQENQLKNKTEVKALLTARPDPDTMFGLQLKFKQSNNNTALTESDKITMEDVWLEKRVDDNLTVRVGSMPLTLGHGLWLDGDGLAGLGANWTIDKNNKVFVVAGKDSQDETVKQSIKSVTSTKDPVTGHVTGVTVKYNDATYTSLFQALGWEHTFDKGKYGLYVGRQDISKYRGGFFGYDLTDKLQFNTEYVKNTGVSYNGRDTRSIVAELKYGKLKKQGDLQFVATYLDSDPGVFVSEDYTAWDDNYDPDTGFKGIGGTINYKLSKTTQLQYEQFWGSFKSTGKYWNNIGLKLTAKF